MSPIDYRQETWEMVQKRVVSLRLSVWRALAAAGACTTRELAKHSGMDLLTVRPRITELVQLGFVRCLDDKNGHEGTYEARTLAEAERLYEMNRQASAGEQLEMKF